MKKCDKKRKGLMSKKERARMGHLEPCEVPLKEIKELVCSALFQFHDILKSGFPGANLIQILNSPQWHK